MHPKVIDLADDLHTNSWFQYGNLNSCVKTTKEGRQGCKLGGIIFNGVYNEALKEVRDTLREKGIILNVKTKKEASFWERVSEEEQVDTQEVVEATFVDDEGSMLMSNSPRALDMAIHVLLTALRETFKKFQIEIHWKKESRSVF